MSADTGGTDEVREAAASWTMAHDKMLLGHLNRFGDSIDKRTEEMKRKLSALRGDTKRAEDALGLLTNEFMVLANEVRRARGLFLTAVAKKGSLNLGFCSIVLVLFSNSSRTESTMTATRTCALLLPPSWAVTTTFT